MRKELETHGIEYYPQNEFDDDMEDKNENDKIRVRASVPIFFKSMTLHPTVKDSITSIDYVSLILFLSSGIM